MYRQEDSIYISDVDSLELSTLTVLPDGDAKAVMMIMHGMCEYKERYLPFMQYLASKGIASVIYDQRGHGKSVKSKKDLGFMYSCGVGGYLKDMVSINEMIRGRFPGLPLILFGHSMGSLAVRAFASEHDDLIDMLIVCGSPSDNAAKGIGKTIAKTEGRIRGLNHKSQVLEKMSFGGYAAKFRNEKSPFAWLCTDPEVVKAYEESDYCGFTFTDEAYQVLFELMEKAYDIKKWILTNQRMPVLFISGEDDPCMGNIQGFSKAVQAMRNAGYRDVRGKVYKGMRHEILNEKDKETVYEDIVKYIFQKISKEAKE